MDERAWSPGECIISAYTTLRWLGQERSVGGPGRVEGAQCTGCQTVVEEDIPIGKLQLTDFRSVSISAYL